MPTKEAAKEQNKLNKRDVAIQYTKKMKIENKKEKRDLIIYTGHYYWKLQKYSHVSLFICNHHRLLPWLDDSITGHRLLANLCIDLRLIHLLRHFGKTAPSISYFHNIIWWNCPHLCITSLFSHVCHSRSVAVCDS